MNSTRHVRREFIAASIVIVGFLVLQVGSTFKVFCPPKALTNRGMPILACDPSLYPFLEYPMYSSPHYVGDVVDVYDLYATLSDGKEVRVLADQDFVNFWHYQQFVDAIRAGDKDLIGKFVRIYEQEYHVQAASFRLEDTPWTIQAEGPVEGERYIVTRVDVGGTA